MKIKFNQLMHNAMTPELYETLPLKTRADFIVGQDPVLKKTICVTKTMKEKYGSAYWSYKLKNGWRCFPSATAQEAARKYNEFMESAKDGGNSDKHA